MSTPFFSTSPATPRKDAAERYSPLMAAAFHRGLTIREATRKSDVVRARRNPYAPIATVTKVTVTIAGSAYGFDGTVSALTVGALDEIGEIPLGPLGDAHIERPGHE